MSVASRLLLTAVVAGVTLCSLSITSAVVQSVATDAQITSLRAEAAAAETDMDAAELSQFGADVIRLATQTDYTVRQSVLDERPGFVAAVAAADAAFASAKDKVDVASSRAAVIAAQDAVRAERLDSALVRAQTTAVTDIATAVTAEVKAHDDRIAAARAAASRTGGRTGGSGGAVGGPGWFADMRQRLTNVGGSHVELREFDGQCGGTYALACAYSQGYIAVAPGIASWSGSRKNWAMVHELAHTYHFARWGAVAGSGGYSQLFGSNPELLANCMASARGYTDHGHNSQCNSDRLAWAAALWNGNVAW